VRHPRALIFDLDGTLVDSAPGICASCRAACLALGYPEPSDDAVRPLIGLPLQRLLRGVVPVELDEARLRPPDSEVERLVADASKAKELLGWESEVTLDEGLRQTIDWMSETLGSYRASIYNV
jgi:phosphoglycolate phosphatase-like HAD superfamily hydrolase